jgi:drug/metabolite transporter (DMT)-like permease
MSTSAVLLVLLAAVLHAGWNALLRVSGDRLTVMALLNGCAGAIAFCLLPFAGLPDARAWPMVLTSTGLHLGYNLFLVAAYAHGGLGQVYPIARGAAPLLVLVLAWVFLGEAVSGLQVLAVLITSGGIAALAFAGGRHLRLRSEGLFFALGTAGFIGAYTVVDAAGARAAGSPHRYALTLFVLDGLACLAVAIARRRGTMLTVARRDWRSIILAGAMSLAAYWLVLWALTLAPAANVAALRETSVVIAALIGALVLKEPLGGWRVTAAGVVAVGAILLRM